MLSSTSAFVFCVILASAMACKRAPCAVCREETTAVVKITPAESSGGVSGTVMLTETSSGLRVVASIDGLTSGKHGFHIHQKGNLGNKCVDACGHYNPFNKEHGAPTDDNRHVGDLGNIVATAGTTATLTKTFAGVTLKGQYSVIGRAIVIHSGEDDLGKGGDAGSKATGNAGSRVACGVIGVN